MAPQEAPRLRRAALLHTPLSETASSATADSSTSAKNGAGKPSVSPTPWPAAQPSLQPSAFPHIDIPLIEAVLNYSLPSDHLQLIPPTQTQSSQLWPAEAHACSNNDIPMTLRIPAIRWPSCAQHARYASYPSGGNWRDGTTDHSCATESALEFVGMCPVNSHSTCLQQQGFRMHAQIGPAAAPTLQHQRASAAMQHPLCDRVSDVYFAWPSWS